jgi:hypothetical protein
MKKAILLIFMSMMVSLTLKVQVGFGTTENDIEVGNKSKAATSLNPSQGGNSKLKVIAKVIAVTSGLAGVLVPSGTAITASLCRNPDTAPVVDGCTFLENRYPCEKVDHASCTIISYAADPLNNYPAGDPFSSLCDVRCLKPDGIEKMNRLAATTAPVAGLIPVAFAAALASCYLGQ